MKNIILFVFALLIASAVFTSCKEDEQSASENTAPQASTDVNPEDAFTTPGIPVFGNGS